MTTITHPDSNADTIGACVDRLLRDTPGTLERIGRRAELGLLARAMMLCIAVGGGLFGAAMGAYRSGLQVPYAAVKLPAAILLAMAVCAPVLSCLNAALGRPAQLQRDLALLLVTLGRTSLVLAAEAPIVLLAVRFGVSYHGLIILVVGCCAVAGAIGLVLLLRGLSVGAAERRGLGMVALSLLGVFAMVGTQMAWTLRPFVLRPRTPEVVLVRSIEGSFLDAVLTSSRSARGVYWRQEAPLPEP